MRSKISQLTEQKSTLEKYLSGADSNWSDRKKQEFFSAHIAPLRQSYAGQIEAMEQVAAAIESAEREIKSLM